MQGLPPPGLCPKSRPPASARTPPPNDPSAGSASGAWLLIAAAAVLILAAVVLWRRHAAARPQAAAAHRAAAPASRSPPPRQRPATSTSISTPSAPSPRSITDSITSQVNGLVIAVHFKEGQLVQQGRPADRHRSAPVSGDAAAGAGASGARPERAGAGADGPGALPRRAGAQRDRAADARRPGKARAAGSGHRQERSGHRAVSTSCRSTTATSPRRSAARSACAWSIRATWCRPMAPPRWR